MATPVFQPPPTHAEVVVRDPASKWIFNPTWTKWFLDLVRVLNNSGGGSGTIVHNSTSGLQGGAVGEYYHLTAVEHAFVAAVATGSDSAHFLRGDNTWSQTLTGPFSVNGNVTIGDASADTLTINAGTWVYGNPWSATLSVSTVAGGVVNLMSQASTIAQSDSGGTSNIRGLLGAVTLQGGNPTLQVVALRYSVATEATATLSNASGVLTSVDVNGSGNLTNANAFSGAINLTSSGNVTAGNIFSALAPTLSSTGAITSLIGFNAGNLGNATLVTNAYGFNATNMTGAVTQTAGFRSQMNSGTGKWGFFGVGTANNAFVGNVRIGSTTVPTVALDVTGSVIVSGDTTLGDASGDALTINGGTWTFGSDWTATRNAGTVAAGTVQAAIYNYNFTGDAGGTTSARAWSSTVTTAGGNAISAAFAQILRVNHGGSSTLDTAQSYQASLTVGSTGNVTNLTGYGYSPTLSSSGNVTTATGFSVAAPILSSTGAITGNFGFSSGDLGHATLVTNAIGFNAANMTAATTLTAAFRSQMNSGTTKWGFYASGTADNSFNGNVRIGSNTAPTAALDVTGTILGSVNFTAWAAWTPTRTGWTDVGGPTVTARFCRVRNVMFFQIKVVPATTVATVAGTSYTDLPVAAGGSGLGGDGSMVDKTTLVSIGNIVIDTANSRCYVPTQTGTADTLLIDGWYEV